MTNTVEQDTAFWQAAYQDHGGAVLGYLRKRLGGQRSEAEDLLQETFVRAIRAGSFRRDGNLRSYLFQAAQNLLISRARRPRLVVSHAQLEEPPEAADGTASPETRAHLEGFRQHLEQALAGLGESHRRAFELGVIEQHSYREIASLMGWTMAQVKINIYRARSKVIEALEASGHDRRAL